MAKGITRRHEQLEAVAWALDEALPDARGAMCFQAIVDAAGRAVVFELNAGSVAVTRSLDRAGARFAQGLLEEKGRARPSASTMIGMMAS